MTTETTNIAAPKVVVSRVGKAPIPVPPKVTVAIKAETVTVKGPLGELTRTFKGVRFEEKSGSILVHALEETRTGKALHGLGRNLLRNMVQGVSAGYKRELDVIGVGYRVEAIGQALKFSIGYSHPVLFPLPTGVACKIEKQTHLELTGVDKEELGQVAANIRSLRPPEPYKGKGIRYTDEKVRQKAGKSGGKGGKKK
jgi:large subunit ribosomal protein L6